MSTPSAFDQYVINNLPVNPGDITSGSVVDGSQTIYYWKTGNLYFGFRYYTGGGSTQGIICQGSGPNLDLAANRIATLLGLTINTLYYQPYSTLGGGGTYGVYYRSSPLGWFADNIGNGGTGLNYLAGFLSN